MRAVSVDITKFKNSRLSATIVSQSGSTLICAPRATDDLNGHCYVGYGPLKELTNIEFDFGTQSSFKFSMDQITDAMLSSTPIKVEKDFNDR